MLGDNPALIITVTPVELNNVIYFDGSEAAHGLELWKNDGSVAGTSLVADISPGPASSSPSSLPP